MATAMPRDTQRYLDLLERQGRAPHPSTGSCDPAAALKHRNEEQAIYVTPHRVRHNFGAEHRARSGSDTETAAALGHTGLARVARHVRRTRDERRSIIDDL